MAMVRKTTPIVNDVEKALVLHSSSAALRGQPPPIPVPVPDQSGNLDLLDSLYRHWMLALCVFLAIAVVGTMWSVNAMRPVYQAETTIYVPPDLGKDDSAPATADIPYPTLVNQQIMTILHYDTLSEAIQQLARKGVPWKLKGETEGQSVDRLRAALDVQRVPDSFEISIEMMSAEPATAATIVNTVAQSFLDERNRPDTPGRVNRAAALDLEKATLEKELQKQLDLRGKLSESLQVVNLHKSTTLPDDEVLLQMHQALAAAHRKRIEAEAQLQAGAATVATEAERLAGADPAVNAATTNLLAKQFELREKIKTMLPAHPVRKQAEADLATIDAELKTGPGNKIAKLTAQLMENLRSQAEESRRIEADLTQEIALESSGIPDMQRSLGQAELINGDIARIQDHLNRVNGDIEQLNLRSASEGALRVFSVAQAPTVPLKNQRFKALAITFAMALVLALGLPVVLDMADSRIYDPATIERILGFPVVGMTIVRTSKTEPFADEHLRRLVAGIERGIAEGARTVLLTGLKQSVPQSVIADLSRSLTDRDIDVVVRSGRRNADPDIRTIASVNGTGVALAGELDSNSVVLMDAPALVFSAEAERLAAEADMTLVVVQAGSNTRPDLVRGARLLERLNVAAVGIILQDVRVERAGRSLRRDLKEYLAFYRQPAGLSGSWGRL
jgi:capsular polysaccharide biosynthesis protein